jgi:hypothetical protein
MLAKSMPKKNDAELLLQCCKDIEEWPNRWEIDEADVIIGQAINEYFKLFLIEKIKQGRAKKTIRITGNYLWALGGELIRQINYNETERKLSAKNLILKYVDQNGGPYWRHASNDVDHDKYDSVCKQFFKFLSQN